MSVSYCGEPLRYSIFDPTGNITALVETPVVIDAQPAVAAFVMREHPEVEQVGYVRFIADAEADDGVHVELRMAGGEFCGNATMSAAAAYALWSGFEAGSVLARVSGAAHPVEVRLSAESDGSFAGSVHMPQALSIERFPLTWEDTSAELPLVRMEGISHLVIEPHSAFYWLLDDRAAAEQAVRAWCAELKVDGLGLMFLLRDSSSPSQYHLTPLVYVPSGNTIFWEHSCASGSAATAMYLAKKAGTPVSLTFMEPGGILRAESDPLSGTTYLFGNVSLTARYSSSIA